MANYSNLKTAIENAVDWNNGDNEITGQNLLDILETIIDSLGAKYKFADVATPSSSITTPDEPLFYLAGAGTYTNFSGLSVTIPRGTLAIFYYDTAWHYTTVRTDSDAFFNVNQHQGTPSTTYTKANARNAVPEALRSKGMIITYLTTNGWIIEQNLSTSGTWNADANWQTIGPVSVSQNTETGHIDITIGDTTTPVASADEFEQLGQEVQPLTNELKDIDIAEWLPGGYTAYGSVILESVSYIKRAVIDVSALVGKTLSIHAATYDVIYCGFKDDNGNVLGTLQTSESVSASGQIVVPDLATQMFISTDESYIPTTEVRVRYNNFVEFDKEGYITPNSIKRELPSIGKNIISSCGPNNTYIRANSATETGVASGYTYGISDKVIGGNTYEFVSFDIASPTPSDNIIRFLDENGLLCSWNNQYTHISSGTLNGLEYNIFRVTAPLYSVKAEFNFYMDHTGIAYIKRVYAEGDLETIGWLGIDNHNFTPLAFKKLGDTLVFAPNFADVISKPISFANKSVVAFGDSITAGYTSGTTYTDDSYIQILCDKVGATLDNRAIAGSTFIHRQSTDIVDKVLAYTGSADIIWIAGGTNDFNQNLTIGNWGDTGNNTLYGAVRNICEFLKNNYPNAYVIFLTPVPYTNEAKNSVADFTNLDYYRKAIYEVVTYYGYSIINGKNLGLPNAESDWATTMTTDGLHPTERGHNLMAQSISGKLF